MTQSLSGKDNSSGGVRVSTPPSHRRTTVIAVPARDEADRIGACLHALLGQKDLDGHPLASEHIHVVVLANNCGDDTAAVARSAGGGGRVQVVSVDFPPSQANAGSARRAAMEAAAALLPGLEHSLICTTDADSRARPDWIARLWQAVDGGAEAVAGVVEFDPGEAPVFSMPRQLEAAYSVLQAEIVARVDPETHNPWPNHIWAWGANMAVTGAAYRRVGGLPPAPLAEDRAFVEQLRRHDVPVRHALNARVWTSARRDGRAAGGLASLVNDHSGEDLAPCDAALEPALDVFQRAAWRARLRRAHARRIWPSAWARRLHMSSEHLTRALAAPAFGAAWSEVEAWSPILERRRLDPTRLAHEIAIAQRLLRRLTGDAPTDPADTALAATAGLWSAPVAEPG
jgi:glycosyltransferase involved in cell wall biosynthesis